MTLLFVSLRATALSFVALGALWTLVVTGLAQGVLPAAADGSLVAGPDGPVGSRLLGQAFSSPGYLHGRPSAGGYDPTASGGSNLGPAHPALAERRARDEARLLAENPGAGPVPEVLLAASGSGLDPDLAVEAARWQAARIARARGVEPDRVVAIVDALVVASPLGPPRVNVLEVNLALDRRLPRPAGP